MRGAAPCRKCNAPAGPHHPSFDFTSRRRRSILSPSPTLLSKTKETSGETRSLTRAVTSRRTKPLAASSPAWVSLRSASVPREDQNTRATRRSGLIFTPVMVMYPMRGSRSSPRDSSSPRAAWISAPTRSGRPGTLMAEPLSRLLPVALVAQLARPGARLGQREVSPTPRAGPPLDQGLWSPVPLRHPLGLGQAAVLACEGQLHRAPVVGRFSTAEELVAEGENLQLPADQRGDVHLLHEVDDLLDLLVHVTAVRAHHRQGDGGALPEVLILHLGDRDVEPGLQPVGDATEHLPLRLQRAGVRDLQCEACDADEHGCTSPRGRGAAPPRTGWAGSPRSRSPR